MYVAALIIEMQKLGLEVARNVSIAVYYGEHVVGEYFADLVVAGVVIVEVKAAQTLALEHEAQLLNYLRATPYEVGMLLNFGPKVHFKRLAYDNDRKSSATWLKTKA